MASEVTANGQRSTLPFKEVLRRYDDGDAETNSTRIERVGMGNALQIRIDYGSPEETAEEAMERVVYCMENPLKET